MTKHIRTIKSAIIAVIIAAVLFAFPVIAMADANIGLTTSNGVVEISGDIDVTVQITSDDQIGTYFIELEYDSARMRYLSGAEREQDGILTLTGTGMSKTVTYDLKFTGATGGEAGMVVRTALVNDTSGNVVNTTDSGMLGIVVTGQADNSASFTQKLAEEEELYDSELPVSGTIHDAEGNIFYVIDLTRTTPDIMFFPFDLVEEPFEGQIISFAQDKNGTIKMLPLMDENDNVALYAVNGDMFYPMTELKDTNNNKFVYVSLEACSTMPQKIASDTEMWDYAVYAISRDGTGGFYLIDEKGNLELYTVLNATTLTGAGIFSKVFSGSPIPWERYLIIAAGVIVLIIILVIILNVVLKSNKNRRIRKASDYQYDYSVEEPVSVDEDIDDIDVISKQADAEKDAESAPVSRRAKKEGNAEKAGKKKVSQVKDSDVSKSKKKSGADKSADDASEDLTAVNEPALTEEIITEPVQPEETALTEGDDVEVPSGNEALSLDDIVLTDEDMPEEMRTPVQEEPKAEISVEEEPVQPSGLESISLSESDDSADEMGKTIRIEKIVLEDTNTIKAENSRNDEDVDKFLENIEL